MSKAETAPGSSPPLPVPVLSPLAGFLSFLVPGLGQILQGRVGKGVFFLIVLLGMFHAGQALGGWKNVYMPMPEVDTREPVVQRSYNPLQSIYHRWPFAGQMFIGVSAWPAMWQFFEMPMPSEKDNAFLHHFQREPMTWEKEHHVALRNPAAPVPDPKALSPEGKLNQEIAAGNRNWDVGLVYTIVAGVLNILVIYDAVAGPAFGARRTKAVPDKPQAEVAPS